MASRKQSESTVQAEFRKYVEGPTQRMSVEKLHGGFYQSGLPDLLLVHIDGRFTFVEMKAAWKGLHHPWTARHVVGLLRDGTVKSRQFAVAMNWGVRGARVHVVVGDATDENFPDGECWTSLWMGRIRDKGWEERQQVWTTLAEVVRSLNV